VSAHNCPSCGAKIKSKNAAVCEYCGTSLSASISVGGSTADGQNKILAPELRKLLQRHVQLQDENRKNQPLISISSKQKDKINPETSCLCEIFDNELLFENVERAGMAISFYFERNSQELLRFSNSSYYNIFRHDESAPSNTLSYCLDAGRNVERAEKVITDILSEVYLIGEESELEYTTDFYKFSSSQGSSEFDDDEDEGLSLRTKVYIGLFVIFLIIQLTRCVSGNSDVPSQPPAPIEAVDAQNGSPISPVGAAVEQDNTVGGQAPQVTSSPSASASVRQTPTNEMVQSTLGSGDRVSEQEASSSSYVTEQPQRTAPRLASGGCRNGTSGIDEIRNRVYLKELSMKDINGEWIDPSGNSADARNIKYTRTEIADILSSGDQSDCWIINYKKRNGY